MLLALLLGNFPALLALGGVCVCVGGGGGGERGGDSMQLIENENINTENENEFLHFPMPIHDHKLIRLVSKFISRCFQLRNAADVT